MSDKIINDPELEFINKVIEELEIDIDSIYHVTIVGGVEMVGEMFLIDLDSNFEKTEDDDELISEEYFESNDTQRADYLFLNPIKVFRDSWIDQDGYSCQNYFIEWNPCMDGPYT